jgi:hypothetical protein
MQEAKVRPRYAPTPFVIGNVQLANDSRAGHLKFPHVWTPKSLIGLLGRHRKKL